MLWLINDLLPPIFLARLCSNLHSRQSYGSSGESREEIALGKQGVIRAMWQRYGSRIGKVMGEVTAGVTSPIVLPNEKHKFAINSAAAADLGGKGTGRALGDG
jgi:hypothetical protein